MIDISVVIPVYNGSKHIQHMLNQLARQKNIDNIQYEYIFIDDGSTDDTLQQLKSAKKNDGHIKVIHQKNAGVSSARNSGLDYARGKWIVFIDIDDTISDDFLKIIFDTTSDDADDVIFYARKQYSKSNGKIFRDLPEGNVSLWLLDMRSLDIPSSEDHWLKRVVWSRAYRSSFLKEQNIRFVPNINIGEDFLFIIMVCNRTKKIAFSQKGFYTYCNDGESALHIPRRNSIHDSQKAHYEFQKEAQKYPALQLGIDHYCIERSFIAFGNVLGMCDVQEGLHELKYEVEEYTKSTLYSDTICRLIKGGQKYLTLDFLIKLFLVRHCSILFILSLRMKYNFRKTKGHG